MVMKSAIIASVLKMQKEVNDCIIISEWLFDDE